MARVSASFRRLARLDFWMETGRNYVRGWLVDRPIAKTEQSLRFRHLYGNTTFLSPFNPRARESSSNFESVERELIEELTRVRVTK